MMEQARLNSGAGMLRVVISVNDLETAKAFYRELLGLGITDQAPGFARLRTLDDVELLLHERPASPSDAAVSIGFDVEDLHGVICAWRREGGTVLKPPEKQAWGELMAVVRDTDGHIVCLSQRKQHVTSAQ